MLIAIFLWSPTDDKNKGEKETDAGEWENKIKIKRTKTMTSQKWIENNSIQNALKIGVEEEHDNNRIPPSTVWIEADRGRAKSDEKKTFNRPEKCKKEAYYCVCPCWVTLCPLRVRVFPFRGVGAFWASSQAPVRGRGVLARFGSH